MGGRCTGLVAATKSHVFLVKCAHVGSCVPCFCGEALDDVRVYDAVYVFFDVVSH